MNYIHKIKLANKSEWESIQIVTVDEEMRQAKWLSDVNTIVEVGIIIKPATYDGQGNELTPHHTIEGWHVDILANSIIEELRECCLDHAPANPQHGYGWGYTRDNLGNVIAPILVFKEGELQL